MSCLSYGHFTEGLIEFTEKLLLYQQQHEYWTKREIDLTQDFEKVTRNCLTENHVEITLTIPKQHYHCSMQIMSDKA